MNGFLWPICNFSFTPLSSWEKTSNTILDVSVVADWWKSSSPFVTSCSSPTSLKRFQIQEYNRPLGNCSECLYFFSKVGRLLVIVFGNQCLFFWLLQSHCANWSTGWQRMNLLFSRVFFPNFLWAGICFPKSKRCPKQNRSIRRLILRWKQRSSPALPS